MARIDVYNKLELLKSWYLEERKASWLNSKNRIELGNNIRDGVLDLLGIISQGKIEEEGLVIYAMAKFFQGFLGDKEKEILGGLVKRTRDAQQVKEEETVVNQIHGEIMDFFVSYGRDYEKKERLIKLTRYGSRVMNLVVMLELERIVVDQQGNLPKVNQMVEKFVTQVWVDRQFFYIWMSKDGERKTLEEIKESLSDEL